MVEMAQVHAHRICLIGPHSTGKSTLAEALASHFETEWVPEFAREYALRAAGRELTYDDVSPIGEGQLAGELRARPRNGLLILDTDLLSTAVYSRHYYGRCPLWIEQTARERAADLYLLMNVDTPFVDDPARDSADAREALFLRFRDALIAQKARVEVVRGGWKARQAAAIALASRLLRS
jgi:HTH-type transcriptional repressor of NAD biosynthesis genes